MYFSKGNMRSSRRSKSANVKLVTPEATVTVLDTTREETKVAILEEVTENANSSGKHDRKAAKSAKGRLEGTQPTPKLRNPRDHPMVKVVGKTRALIGQAKKAQCSTAFVDPEKSQQGSIIEKQLKKKAAKLEKRKREQVLENDMTNNKVMDYLSSNPAGQAANDVDNAVSNYGQARNALIEKNISLISSLERDIKVIEEPP